MIIQDRSKMVYLSPNTAAPFAQFRAYNGAVRGMSGMSGILETISSGIDSAINNGLDSLDGFITQLTTGQAGPNIHIAAQNQAVADMGKIISLLQQLKSQNQLTVGVIDQAIAGIKAISNRFVNFARSIGSTRALQGARDVETLAYQLVQDREKEKAALGGSGSGVPVPTIDPVTGAITYAPAGGIGSFAHMASNYLPYILLGAFVFLLPKLGKYERR